MTPIVMPRSWWGIGLILVLCGLFALALAVLLNAFFDQLLDLLGQDRRRNFEHRGLGAAQLTEAITLSVLLAPPVVFWIRRRWRT